MGRTVGIDPGLDGALACIGAGDDALLEEMPVLTVAKGKGTRRVVDAAKLRYMLRSWDRQFAPLFVCIEAQQAMPAVLRGRAQGTASSFQIGRNFGLIHGVVVGLELAHTFVHPQSWKRAYGLLRGTKGDAINRAHELFPSITFARKKDHGLAEALLLAHYARERHPYGAVVRSA